MAIMRNQQPANLDSTQQGTVSVQQSSAPFQTAGRDTRVDTSGIEVLQSVLNTAARVSGKVFENAAEAEYLKGANAAAAGKAEEDLDANPLTAPFQRGGFNDQYKRLQMANVATDISANMTEYAKMSPQEFAALLDERTAQIYTDTDGMTLQGRKSLLENQLTFSRTLIRSQSAAAAKYRIQQRAAMYNSQGNALVTLAAQAKASGDTAAYGEATAATLAWARSILQDEALPQETRQQQVTSMMSYMLSNDLRTPVETAVNSGLFNDLSSKQLSQLQTGIRESRNRTKLQENTDVLDTWAQLRARQATQGDVPLDDFNNVLNTMAERELISQEGYVSAQTQFLKDYAKTRKSADLANAFATGNQTYMLQNGATREDGVNAYIKTAMRRPGATAGQVANQLISVGMQTGFPEAYTRAGQLIEPAMTNFGTEEQMSPDAAEMVTSILTRTADAELQGDKTAWSKLLRGMSDENREKLVYMREQMKQGKTPAQAGQAYIKTLEQYQGITPQERTQILSQRRADINEIVSGVESAGWGSRTWLALSGIFSSSARAEYQTRVASGSGTTNYELGAVAGAFREELEAVALQSPYAPKESLRDLAMAKVANRVLRVGETTTSPGSVLIAPRGQTAQSALGLDPDVAPDRIGSAIDRAIRDKVPEGFDPSYRFNDDGSISVDYYSDDKGHAPITTTLSPEVVREQIREDDRAAATANNEVYGEGRLMVDPTSKIGIRVNGVNTAGVDEQNMLEARAKLVEFEGIRNKTYRDTRGVATNGVGISSLSPQFASARAASGEGGTLWSPRTIHDTFVAHTNMVARQMPGTANALGWSKDNPNQFQFMMQLGYQGGDGWYRRGGAYGQLADAIRTGNQEDALGALRRTDAYTAAQDSRKRYYEQTLIAGMQE